MEENDEEYINKASINTEDEEKNEVLIKSNNDIMNEEKIEESKSDDDSDSDSESKSDNEYDNEEKTEKKELIKSFESEKEKLISKQKYEKKEKENLVKILIDLQNELQNSDDSIDTIYEKYSNDDENLNNRKIRRDRNKYLIYFLLFVIAPVFGIVYLIGTFQIISLLKSLFDLLKESIICYFFSDKCKDKYLINDDNNPFDFFNYFYKKSMDETMDFNLMMATGFIGDLLLKSTGFTFSSLLFWFLTFACLFLILNFQFQIKYTDKTDENDSQYYIFDYNFYKILYILLCYILLLIGIGSSSLLSQKILQDSFSKYISLSIDKEKKRHNNENDKLENNNEENNNKSIDENKKDIEIKEIKKSKSSKNYFNIIKQIMKSSEKDKEKAKGQNKFNNYFIVCVTTVLGYYFKHLINLLLNHLLKKYFDNEDIKKLYFYSIIGLYSISVFISIGLYSFLKLIFTKNQKNEKKENSYRVCEICGYIIFSQNKITEEGKNRRCCDCCSLCFKSIKNCCNQAGCSIFRRMNKYANIVPICECCCCCCCDYNEDDYQKKKEFFCYCYQSKRKSNWCNKFITNETQITLAPYMIEYFLIQFSIIAFDKHYEKNKINNTNFLIIFISVFLFFFYLTISCGKMIKYYFKSCMKKKKIKIKKSKDVISKLSTEILEGSHGVFIFNIIFSIIFSPLYLSKKYEKSNYIILIPILMNKFYYFTLNYYCLCVSKTNKGLELISGSTLISLYIMVWNFIRIFINEIVGNIETLYFIQIIFISLPSLLIGLIILIYGFFRALITCNLFRFLCCIISFFTCCGGFWIRVDHECNYNYTCFTISDIICFIICIIYLPFYFIFGCCARKLCCCIKGNKCYNECCYYLCNIDDDEEEEEEEVINSDKNIS